jgi:DNA-binding transcriptional MerR regulator
MFEEKPIEKKYYGISEVSNMLGVNSSLLRFWEKEFPSYIKPKKNKKGNRYYTAKDIEQLKLIYYLVKDRGFTLEGAKKKLRNNPEDTIKNAQIVDELKRMRTILTELRDEFPIK